MAMFDFPLEQLQVYRPERDEPDDFDAFWSDTLAEARRFPLDPIYAPYEIGLKWVEVFDVTFNGFGGHPIKAWLLLPRQREGKLPCIVEYIGYGGGRGKPIDWLAWSSFGYAHLIMDNRGQGRNWGMTGYTPDPAAGGVSPHFPGFMTMGIDHPAQYYYRRLFTDAVRAVETARAHPAIDPERVGVGGGSQGGGITLAVSALMPDVALAMSDVPFLCHYRTATQITDANPYNEIARYCQFNRGSEESVFETLAYFDGVNFATRARCPALFSVGLMDEVCPPRTVYAAYNHYSGEKSIRVYAYNHHEGGGTDHLMEKLAFAGSILG